MSAPNEGGPLNRLLGGLGLDDKLPPIPTVKPITVKPVKVDVIARRLDDIDPDWPNKFTSTDAAARFYRTELDERTRMEERRAAMLERGVD